MEFMKPKSQAEEYINDIDNLTGLKTFLPNHINLGDLIEITHIRNNRFKVYIDRYTGQEHDCFKYWKEYMNDTGS